jgi:hypothetical protein
MALIGSDLISLWRDVRLDFLFRSSRKGSHDAALLGEEIEVSAELRDWF